ncbi:hypothetical protein TPENAI_50169 [Tenacibaculum litopenaei]
MRELQKEVPYCVYGTQKLLNDLIRIRWEEVFMTHKTVLRGYPRNFIGISSIFVNV